MIKCSSMRTAIQYSRFQLHAGLGQTAERLLQAELSASKNTLFQITLNIDILLIYVEAGNEQ